MSTENHKNLGRGLAALFGEVGPYTETDLTSGSTQFLSVEKLKPGKMQPRQIFEPEAMENLMHSIQQKGILQPLLVRHRADDFYEIVAGERRWRAAKRAGLSKVPIILLNCSDQEALEIGLVENLQRDDLNPLEEAESLQRLIQDHHKTQEQIAFALGKSRSYVANMLRLNQLPDNVKQLIREGKLTAGHARTLIHAPNSEELARKIVENKLSVRDSENLARQNRQAPLTSPAIDPDIQMITQRIGEKLGMKTKLQFTRNGGALTFYFQSFEQLDEFLGQLAV